MIWSIPYNNNNYIKNNQQTQHGLTATSHLDIESYVFLIILWWEITHCL